MDLYGLIGYPLEHSFSAKYFNTKFSIDKIEAHYELFPVESASALLDLIKDPALKGLNVTSPYKEDVIPFLDQLADEAKEIGAVNVIAIQRRNDGVWLCGHNSDALGFEEAYGKALIEAKGRDALVLGTGGASKAVAYALKKLGFNVTKVSRSESKDTITYQSLTKERISKATAIVNATPIGMLGHQQGLPPIPYDGLHTGQVCIDLIYNPRVTEFMHACGMCGPRTFGGYPMLKAQAEGAWKIWNSKS